MLNNRRSRLLPLFIIYIFITFFSLGALLIAIWFSKSSYSSLVNFVIETLKRPDLKPLITSSLFTLQKYQVIYKYHWVVYPIIIVSSATLYYYAKTICKNGQFAFSYIQLSFFHIITFFKNLSRKEKLLLALGSLSYVALVLHNNHLKNISYDEAWGYNYYINKPFYFPLILFNTYPLFNLITHFFTFLPFDTLINIRLPTLLFGLLSLVALFYTLYKQAGFVLSFFAVIILASSPLFYIYSSLSRGITLSLFLSVLVLNTVIQLIIDDNFHKRYWFLYILFNILGIISMPTFFVYTICNSLFLILHRYGRNVFLKSIIIATSIICVASFIFYLPIILNSGLSLIYHNNHYAFNIVDTVKKFSSFLFGLSKLFFFYKYVTILLLLISLGLIFSSQAATIKRTLIKYSFFVIITTMVLRAITGNIFPERSLNYLILCFLLILILFITLIFNRVSFWLKASLTLPIIVFVVLAFTHNRKELFSPVEDTDAKIISEKLLTDEVQTAYIDEEEFWYRVPMIQYYYSKEHKQINFATSAKNSTRFLPFNIRDQYDCIITRPSFNTNLSAVYKVIYRNNSFVVWKIR